MASILETRQLTHVFSEGTPFRRCALDRIDLRVERGEFVGIIGHTGSGKSTLIQHLNGLLKPTSGTVLFEGRDIWENKVFTREIRFRVGLAFQYPEHQLFAETVYQDIAFGPQNMALSKDEVHARVMRAAEAVGIKEKTLKKSPFEVSGGQKRRIALAGIIAMEPDVLILDEPTAGLDPLGRDRLLDYVRGYQSARNATVIMVSHSMEDIASTVERLIVMNDGRIEMTGTPHGIFSDAKRLTCIGLDIPQITKVFLRLQELGLDVDPAVYTTEQAKRAILSLRGEDADA